jgi:uncharacterized repeat protein (TIGR01451 family)
VSPVQRALALLFVLLFSPVSLLTTSTLALAQTTPVIWYVSPAGNDSNDCRAPDQTCQTIGAAIAKAADGDTIRIAGGLYNENLVIDKRLTLIGEGAATTIIDGGQNDSVVRTGAFGQVIGTIVIKQVTLTNGAAVGGGGLLNLAGTTLRIEQSRITGNTATRDGGGVSNQGTLTMIAVTVDNNTADRFGGGIGNGEQQQLTIDLSRIENNRADGGGGGIMSSGPLILRRSTVHQNETVSTSANGGGITTAQSAELRDCRISANEAGRGGGGVSAAGDLTVFRCTIIENRANGSFGGGGILNQGTAVIGFSTIAANTATANGGGIANYGSITEAANSTISGNSARIGGGIHSTGSINLVRHLTITANDADEYAGGMFSQDSILVQQTILAGNTAPLRPDCDFAFWTRNYNLLGINSEREGGLPCLEAPKSGDIVGSNASPLDPQLGPLQDNGGPTFTHALLAGSPALDSVDPNLPPGLGCLATDQRGVPRPSDGDGDGEAWCDMGAYEESPEGPPVRLDLDKQVSNARAEAGDIVTYTITAIANGNQAGIIMTDTLPLGLTYVDGTITGGASYDPASRQIRFAGDLAKNERKTITYAAMLETDSNRVAPGTSFTNTVIVTSDGQRFQDSATVVVPISPTDFDGTLVLIYANGDNRPGPTSLSAEVLQLVNRVEQAASNPNIRVNLLLDGPEDNDSRRFEIVPGLEPCIDYSSALERCAGRYVEGENMHRAMENLGDPNSLTAFLQSSLAAHPGASQVILTLVGHGGGWSPELLADQPSGHKSQPSEPTNIDGYDQLGGLLWDDHPGVSLSTPELARALAQVPPEVQFEREHLIDLLYLDACSMAMAEVAYAVRNSVHYLLASPNTKWAHFPYDQHLNAITAARDARAIGLEWLKHEQAGLDDLAGHPYTYSLIDVTRMDTLKNAMDDLSEALQDALPTDRSTIAAAAAATTCYDSNLDGPIDANDTYCDLAHFAEALVGQFGATSDVGLAAQQVQQTTQEAVVANAFADGSPWLYEDVTWTFDGASGLSVFLPLGEDTWKRRFYGDRYLQLTADGTWDEFVQAWWQQAPAPDELSCGSDGCDLPRGIVPLRRIFAIYLPLLQR